MDLVVILKMLIMVLISVKFCMKIKKFAELSYV